MDTGPFGKRADFDSEADIAAVKYAGRYVNGNDVEVWQYQRVVAKLPHGQPDKVIW